MDINSVFFWWLQRDYEEFKVKINALVATAQKVPEEGWTMQDGTPWPGNNVRDHPGMIQVSDVYCFISVLCGILRPADSVRSVQHKSYRFNLK